MTISPSQKRAARDAGAAAYWRGEPRSACPHPAPHRRPIHGRHLIYWWEVGWEAARREDLRQQRMPYGLYDLSGLL